MTISPNPTNQDVERRVAVASGAAFILIMLAIAIFIPHPSQFQYIVFRIVLALAAAAFMVTVPGFLHITLGNWLKATGALAVFVLVFLFNPAALIEGSTADGSNTLPNTASTQKPGEATPGLDESVLQPDSSDIEPDEPRTNDDRNAFGCDVSHQDPKGGVPTIRVTNKQKTPIKAFHFHLEISPGTEKYFTYRKGIDPNKTVEFKCNSGPYSTLALGTMIAGS